MRNSWYKKGLVFGIIVLFIGCAFAPSITADVYQSKDNFSISNDSELVEIIVTIHKENEVIENKVQLTRQQADRLDLLIERIRTDFNDAKTNEETIEFYNDAVLTLSDLGLIPEDVTTEELQQIITGKNIVLPTYNFKENNEKGNGIEDRLCFVTGEATESLTIDAIGLISGLLLIPTFAFLVFILNPLIYRLEEAGFTKLANFLKLIYAGTFDILLYTFASSVFGAKPFSVRSIKTFGSRYFDHDLGYIYTPSRGWINTSGPNGNQSYSGKFYGQIGIFPVFTEGTGIGIVGFTGTQIAKDDKVFILGNAKHVKVGPSFPEDNKGNQYVLWR